MSPYLAKSIEETRTHLAPVRDQGKTIGLVPTMGALHDGHQSLIRAARQETDCVVVSIFVNPTQFGPREDLDKYPRKLEQDLEVCGQEKVDVVFYPSPKEIYPEGFSTYVEVKDLQDFLCGVTRPTHFRGVTTIVLKLLNIVAPHKAYFGQKDAQQARILQQMVKDLNVPVELSVLPIVREPDGLAMSSRNQYLDRNQRQHATALFHALEDARQRIENGERNAGLLKQVLTQRLASTPGARIDYVAVVDHKTLMPVNQLRGEILVALAVYFGETRLIDNFIFDIASE